MKKLSKLKLKDSNIMDDAEMKMVTGGYYSGAVTCTVSLSCANGPISCTSSTGDCSNIWENGMKVAIKCESNTYRCK